MPIEKNTKKVPTKPKTKKIKKTKTVSRKSAKSSASLHVGPKVSVSSKKKTLSSKLKIKASLKPRVAVKKDKIVAEKGTGKPRVAIVSLTSCEGCQFALLDMGEKFLELVGQIEMIDFRLLEDEEDFGGKLDLAIVEGNPMTKENMATLKSLRRRAKLLVVLGNCAAMGGIPEIKNYQEGKNTIKHVYKYIQGIDNPEVREVDNFVKVDFSFPGCPISADEFLKYFPVLLEVAKTGDRTKLPQIPDLPVCVQCKEEGNRCLLLDKKPCFGPMILGGCHAVCPSSRMMCQGCRGLRKGGNVKAMRQTLKPMMTDEEFENTSEIYGLRDEIEGREAGLAQN